MNSEKKRDTFKKWVEKMVTPKKPLESINGLYLGDERYLRIVPQPEGKPEFVSSISRTATDFQLASRYGNIGLVAHNYLGGQYFLSLKIGDSIYVMNGKQRTRRYTVTKILKFQALDPRSPHSNFVDLENRKMLSASDVFKRIYMGNHHLVLQTCIQKGNIREWGRHFVIAEPAPVGR